MPAVLTFLAFAFSIVGQSWMYDITSAPNTVTYFNAPRDYYGSTGLIAHEENAEAAFMALSVGDVIMLDDKRYKVAQVERFTAVSPLRLESDFIGANGQRYSTFELSKYIYDKPGALILQTCYDESRGRLFVIALPAMERRMVYNGRR